MADNEARAAEIAELDRQIAALTNGQPPRGRRGLEYARLVSRRGVLQREMARAS